MNKSINGYRLLEVKLFSININTPLNQHVKKDDT
jgi:hypothetical protein